MQFGQFAIKIDRNVNSRPIERLEPVIPNSALPLKHLIFSPSSYGDEMKLRSLISTSDTISSLCTFTLRNVETGGPITFDVNRFSLTWNKLTTLNILSSNADAWAKDILPHCDALQELTLDGLRFVPICGIEVLCSLPWTLIRLRIGFTRKRSSANSALHSRQIDVWAAAILKLLLSEKHRIIKSITLCFPPATEWRNEYYIGVRDFERRYKQRIWSALVELIIYAQTLRIDFRYEL